MADPLVFIVGIGADGWPSMSAAAQQAVREAGVIVGSMRQLALIGPAVQAARVPWPRQMMSALPGFLDTYRGRGLAILASGDPMFFGIGSNVVRLLGTSAVVVLPHPSSMSLACARLGWPIEEVDVVSLVGRPLATLQAAVQPARRLIVLVSDFDAAATVAAMLAGRGFGPSVITLLEQLGGPAERILRARASTWTESAHDRLAILAIECVADPKTVPLPRTPGLPDDAFEHDGQITKSAVRAVTLAALMPIPGQLLWDVGAGSGSVGIEWMRSHPACRAIAIESRGERRDRIARNADALGVPTLQIVAGSAPHALAGLPAPDAIFLGGGISAPGVIDACVAALEDGGRLVANAVTIESEGVLGSWHAALGGTLTRLAIAHAAPVGRFTGWRTAMPVTQWAFRKCPA